MSNLKYIGKNVLNHDLTLKKGNVSGSSTSTGSFGKVAADYIYSNANIEAANRVTANYGTIKYSLVVNENGHGGGDFRVESDNNQYMIWSDASTNKISIGSITSAGGSTLGVTGDIDVFASILEIT